MIDKLNSQKSAKGWMLF